VKRPYQIHFTHDNDYTKTMSKAMCILWVLNRLRVLDYDNPDLITRHANGFVASGNQASVIASLYTAERILPAIT
jgi:hypothetical protein